MNPSMSEHSKTPGDCQNIVLTVLPNKVPSNLTIGKTRRALFFRGLHLMGHYLVGRSGRYLKLAEYTTPILTLLLTFIQ